MKIWTCNEFKGHWAVPTAAVVVARDAEEAAALLKADLEKRGLPQDDLTADKMVQVKNLRKTQVIILSDGEY